MLTYFNLPTATQILASSSEWFNPMWQEFDVFAYAMIGIAVFSLILAGIWGLFRK